MALEPRTVQCIPARLRRVLMATSANSSAFKPFLSKLTLNGSQTPFSLDLLRKAFGPNAFSFRQMGKRIPSTQ